MANRNAIFRDCCRWQIMLFIKIIRPVERPPRESPNLRSAFLIGLVNLPFSSISESLLRKLPLEILTWSKRINPLSMPSWPSFLPQSPIVIPGNGMWVLRSLSGIMNAWGPWFTPSIMSWAQTTLEFDVNAAPPIQNFIDSLHGELITNSFAKWSYVAVVKMPLTLEPWPNSVKAKQLRSVPVSILWRN